MTFQLSINHTRTKDLHLDGGCLNFLNQCQIPLLDLKILGTGITSSEFIASTINLNQTDVTLGLGWGVGF